MIITKEVIINSNGRYNKFYIDLGYKVINKKITVKIEDLQFGSHAKILAKCDVCENEKYLEYKNYNTILNSGGYNMYCCSPKCGKIKTEQTCLINYGVDNPAKADVCKEKAIETCLKIYNTKFHTNHESVIAKKNATVKSKYNVDHTFQAQFVKDKIRKTMNRKYDCDHALQFPDFLQKMKKTCEERIGFDNPSKSENIVKHRVSISDNKAIDYFSELLNENYSILLKCDEDFLVKDHRDDTEFFISKGLIRERIKSKNEISTLKNPVNSGSSTKEIQIFNYIKELGLSPTKDKGILNGKEIDIFIPSHNIALEFNGIHYHCEDYRPKLYHLDKTLKCENKNVILFHIWENEWLYKEEIVKSIINNELHIFESEIIGYDCNIKCDINDDEIKKFLELNNLKPYNKSDINISLYHNDELVSVMIFNKIDNNKYILLDMCDKINTYIIDSYHILFEHFKKNHKFKTIISNSDYRIFNGKQSIYEKLNFTKRELTNVSYFWSKGNKTYNYDDLLKLDLIIDINNITEEEYENIYELGYRKIYDCGQIKWLYKNKN